MKKVFFFLITITVCGVEGKSQYEADLKKIANQIEKEFVSARLQKEDFGPIKVALSNLEVFKAGNNTATQTIRKLQLSKKFKDDDSLFKWLIPAVNKIFLSNYLNNTSFYKGIYDSLFNKLSEKYCPCVSISSRSKDVLADDDFSNCIKNYTNDTALLNAYFKTFLSVPEEDGPHFLSDLLVYSYVHCDDMFDKAIVLAKEEVPAFYRNSMLYYKGTLLETVCKYSLQQKKDSLLQIFPAYNSYLKEINALQKLYKQSNNSLLFTIGDLFANNVLERKSALIADKDTSKIKLLGQFVFEVGIDKPAIYIRSIKYYPRESIQSVEWLEREMEKAKTGNN